MAADIIKNIAGDQAISVQTETIAVSCLPRTKVTVQCRISVDGTGVRVNNLGETDTPFGQKIQRMRFCNSQATSDEQCSVDYRTNFGEGTVFVVSWDCLAESECRLSLCCINSLGRIGRARAAQ
jgi:hypothetical protein